MHISVYALFISFLLVSLSSARAHDQKILSTTLSIKRETRVRVLLGFLVNLLDLLASFKCLDQLFHPFPDGFFAGQFEQLKAVKRGYTKATYLTIVRQ